MAVAATVVLASLWMSLIWKGIQQTQKNLSSTLDFKTENAAASNSSNAMSSTFDNKLKSHGVANVSNTTAPGSMGLAWLLSFPNSGTSFTLNLIRQQTKTTTATNYGQETIDCIPVFQDEQRNGPYFRYPEWNLPAKNILTKTHCSLSTDNMPMNEVDSAEVFETTCSSGNRMVHHNGTNEKRPTLYDPSTVQQAVHLIRDPFDNIVARFHLKVKNWKEIGHFKKIVDSNVFNFTQEGFKAFCDFQDRPFVRMQWNTSIIFSGIDSSLQEDILSYAEVVPCYHQFFHYIRWHNFAVKMLHQREIPYHTLFYEDYGLKFNHTVKGLLDFLVLKRIPGRDSKSKFVTGNGYLDYYDRKEIRNAKKLMRGLASKEVQGLLDRYLK